jgi:methyl-accepting chemotaxis protein
VSVGARVATALLAPGFAAIGGAAATYWAMNVQADGPVALTLLTASTLAVLLVLGVTPWLIRRSVTRPLGVVAPPPTGRDETGRGLAAVAAEIRQLAQQTARASEQIGTQFSAIQSTTSAAVAGVRAVGEAISRMDHVGVVIAAAVEQQGAASREIAACLRIVAGQNAAAAGAMRDVSEVAGRAGGTSATVAAAADLAKVPGTLRGEVDPFLVTMRSEEGEERRYERVSCRGTRAVIAPVGGHDSSVEMIDLSRGSASFVSDLTLPPGTEVRLTLPGGQGRLPARVLRSANGVMIIVFSRDRVEPAVELQDHIKDLIEKQKSTRQFV